MRVPAVKAAAAALRATFVLAALAAAGHAGEGDARGIAIVDYGLYAHRVERIESEPRHVSGQRVIVSGVRLIRRADEVDAQLGRMIGFQFRVADPSLLGKTLTLRRLLPPLTNPETGARATTVDRDIVVNDSGQVILNAYRFDYQWEMTEGLWRFQVLDQGRVIAEKAIKVVVTLH